MIPKNVGYVGYIGAIAMAGDLSRLAAAAADSRASVKDELARPAQTNAIDPDTQPEPPKSRQVRRAEARREAKNRTAYNKRMGFE